MSQHDSQLVAARRLVAYFSERLSLDLSVRLWNGEVLPLKPGARQDIVVDFLSPLAVRRLVMSPSPMTVTELIAEGHIAIEGGTPLEMLRRVDHAGFAKLKSNVDVKFLLKSVLPIVFGKAPAKDASVPTFDKPVSEHLSEGRADKDLISFHYDVSNAFYGLFLDPEMVYSCAYFADPAMSLEEAQVAKLDHICRKLRLQPGDRMLDIGFGWGGLICHAVTKYGVTVHGVTLSERQLEHVTAKVKALGIADRVKLELKDYRQIEGENVYDKVSQVEMFEHLGLANHDRHFEHVRRLMKPRGLYFHQATTRRAPKNLANFGKKSAYLQIINRFIFPGGDLDYIGLTCTNLERLGFEVHDVEALREHFARTCEIWVNRLHERREEAAKEAGWPRTRLWLLYMSAAAHGFETGSLNLFQTVASKRTNGPSGMPWSRRGWLYP
jgi:cyclopropane-fatty-acyl-phospholipid synthase